MITKSFLIKKVFMRNTKFNYITNLNNIFGRNNNINNKYTVFNKNINFFNKNIFYKTSTRNFSSNLNNPKKEKKVIRRDNDYIKERMKFNLIEIMRERFDVLSNHSSLANFFDMNNPHDLLIKLQNTKHLKVYGANNIFFNNSKYILFEIDDKLNLDVLLADDLFLSIADVFNLFTRMLNDLELENVYEEEELISLIKHNYKITSALKDVFEFFVKIIESLKDKENEN